MELTNSEIEKIFDRSFIATSSIGYTLPVAMCEISDNNSILHILLPNEVKVNITIDDIRLTSNLTTIKRIRFTKKSFSCIKLGFLIAFRRLS